MKNKKLNIIITISVIVLILLVGGIFFGLNYSRDDSSLSVMEKKWITDNENKIVDIDVFNNVPVYGYNGSGIIFEFLDYFTKEYGIEFNKVSYYDIDRANIKDLSFLILNSNEEVGDLDILLYEDHYVVLSKDRNDYINIGEVNSVGVLQKDQDLVKNYFGEGVEYFVYENINQLIEWYNLGQFNYLVLPNNEYMSTILSNSYNIVYHVNDLEKKYVLRTHDETLYNVFNKSYLKYKQDEYVIVKSFVKKIIPMIIKMTPVVIWFLKYFCSILIATPHFFYLFVNTCLIWSYILALKSLYVKCFLTKR